MALIKCPECSKEISSSAKICPHCGIKVEKITCPECGKKLKGDEKNCPDCGYPIAKQSTNNLNNINNCIWNNVYVLAIKNNLVICHIIFVSVEAEWDMLSFLGLCFFRFEDVVTLIR